VEANDGYDPDHTGEWHFLGIIFKGDAAMSVLRGLVARYGWVYDLPLNTSVIKHLRALANQPTHSIAMTASEGMALVQEVLAAVTRSAERDKVTVGRLKVAQAVERTIVDNLAENYSVDELARIHEVSREHLTRIFTQEYGMPPPPIRDRDEGPRGWPTTTPHQRTHQDDHERGGPHAQNLLPRV